jgi:uncharacterized protein
MKTIYKYGIPCDIIKDVDMATRTVQAYYYNSQTVDSDGDLIKPGAYSKSILERGPKSAQPRIKHLFNHWEACGVLSELAEDATGGFFTSKMGRHTIGRDTLTMYDDGIITEHSHGFRVEKSGEETVNGQSIRVISEGVLWEVSSLDKWGANQNTPVIKSVEDQSEWIKKLDKLMKALTSGNYTDETFEVFELQVKQIQELLRRYEMREPEQPATSKKPEGQSTKESVNDNSIVKLNFKF